MKLLGYEFFSDPVVQGLLIWIGVGVGFGVLVILLAWGIYRWRYRADQKIGLRPKSKSPKKVLEIGLFPELRVRYTATKPSISYNQSIIVTGILSVLIALALGKNSWVWAILGVGIVWGLWYLWILAGCKKSLEQKLRQLPFFLQALSGSLQAGYSIPQSFGYLAAEMEDPLQTDLQKIVQDLDRNISLAQSLQNWQDQNVLPELDFLIENLKLQYQMGGDLVKVCRKLQHTIEEKLKLQQDLKAFTSQGKMSGFLIAGLWPVSLGVFSVISPSHNDPLHHPANRNKPRPLPEASKSPKENFSYP